MGCLTDNKDELGSYNVLDGVNYYISQMCFIPFSCMHSFERASESDTFSVRRQYIADSLVMRSVKIAFALQIYYI